MYTFIIHLSDVSTKYVLQRMYCAVAFFVKLQTTIRHLIREDYLMGILSVRRHCRE